MNLETANSAPLTVNGVAVGPTVIAPVVDEFSFGLLMNRTLGGSDKRRPSDKSVLTPIQY